MSRLSSPPFVRTEADALWTFTAVLPATLIISGLSQARLSLKPSAVRRVFLFLFLFPTLLLSLTFGSFFHRPDLITECPIANASSSSSVMSSTAASARQSATSTSKGSFDASLPSSHLSRFQTDFRSFLPNSQLPPFKLIRLQPHPQELRLKLASRPFR